MKKNKRTYNVENKTIKRYYERYKRFIYNTFDREYKNAKSKKKQEERRKLFTSVKNNKSNRLIMDMDFETYKAYFIDIMSEYKSSNWNKIYNSTYKRIIDEGKGVSWFKSLNIAKSILRHIPGDIEYNTPTTDTEIQLNADILKLVQGIQASNEGEINIKDIATAIYNRGEAYDKYIKIIEKYFPNEEYEDIIYI